MKARPTTAQGAPLSQLLGVMAIATLRSSGARGHTPAALHITGNRLVQGVPWKPICKYSYQR